MPTRTEEQNQSLVDCEQGVALLRDFNRCLDVFQQRAYSDARTVCQSVHKTALDEEIRSQSLLRIGYSQARLGQFREAQENCATYERTRALVTAPAAATRTPNGPDARPAQQGTATEDEASRLLSDCKALVQRGLAPPPPPAPPIEKPKAWYKRWWVWAIAGTAVGAAAIGLGVGLAQPTPAPEHLTNTWDALTQTPR